MDRFGRGYSSVVAHFAKNREAQNLVVTLVPHEGKDEEDILEILRETIEVKRLVSPLSTVYRLLWSLCLFRLVSHLSLPFDEQQWELKKKVIAVISDTGKITFSDLLAQSPSIFRDEEIDPLTWKETIGLTTVFNEATSLTCYADELQDSLNAVVKQSHVASTLKEFRELATKFKKSPAAIEHLQDSEGNNLMLLP